MTSVSADSPPRPPSPREGGARFGPWLWSPRVDLGVFAGSALVALALVLLAPALVGDAGELPVWGFLAFVIVVDVAHVYATLFRTYLDGAELRRRPLLYAGVPLGCFAAGVALHSASREWFWRCLAYVALFHFIRQQVGWVAIYRARAGLSRSRVDRVIDDAAIYAATLYPVLVWHASPRVFHWFVEGDFFDGRALSSVLPWAFALYVLVLAAYVARALQHARRGTVPIGKHVVVITTVLTWYVGIVATNSDFTFTVANVIVHGVPYVAFLWFYARARAADAPRAAGSRVILQGGLAAFCAVLIVIAFLEEMVWDRLVWQSHPQLFGGGDAGAPLLSAGLTAIVVPLLAVPQATHYVLDAVLWRRRDTGAAQARAMGFGVTA